MTLAPRVPRVLLVQRVRLALLAPMVWPGRVAVLAHLVLSVQRVRPAALALPVLMALLVLLVLLVPRVPLVRPPRVGWSVRQVLRGRLARRAQLAAPALLVWRGQLEPLAVQAHRVWLGLLGQLVRPAALALPVTWVVLASLVQAERPVPMGRRVPQAPARRVRPARPGCGARLERLARPEARVGPGPVVFPVQLEGLAQPVRWVSLVRTVQAAPAKKAVWVASVAAVARASVAVRALRGMSAPLALPVRSAPRA